MSKTFAELIDETQSDLGNDTTTYTDAIVTIQVEKAIKKLSEYQPYIRRVSFYIESRTGTATTDTADSLVDTTEDQFLTTDTDKVIHNTQNNTWATVTSATAAVTDDKLALSKDIFVDGDEAYEIYNKGCSSKYQINVENVSDYVGANHGVIGVEYPVGDRRNFSVDGDILTIDVDSVSDSKVVDPATDTEVLIWFETRQRVTQLTDLPGTVTATAAGATSITFANLSGAEVVMADTLFTIAGVRGTYRITVSKALSGGGGTFTCWPGLESAADNLAVLTIIATTLNIEQERLVVELAAAYTALSIQADAISTGGTGTYRRYETKLAMVLNELSNVKPKTKRTYPRD